MTRTQRDRHEVLRRLGVTLIEAGMTGQTHLSFLCEANTLSGVHRKKFVTSNSPSDHNALKAFERDVTRWLTQIASQ